MSIDAANSTQSGTYASPPITIILTVILLIFFFAGFFSIYFCRCFMETMTNSWHLRRSPSGNHVGPSSSSHVLPGLDPSIIESFPKFAYSTVKHFRKAENYGLECAICLSEFADDDLLRLLSFCCHVFHQDCIDLWLKSHKTCPVCRKNLDAAPDDSPLKCPILCNNNSRHISTNENGENSMEAGSISITINDDNDEYKERKGAGNGDGSAALDTAENVEEKIDEDEKFSRSHSTGHSIVRIRGNDEDRYTLRLPEDVHSRITRGHNWTKSCTAIGDYSNSNNKAATTRNGGFGEVSGVSGGDNDNKV